MTPPAGLYAARRFKVDLEPRSSTTVTCGATSSFIDDIVAGVLAALDHPPTATSEGQPRNRLYNLGNHRSEPLMRVIEVIERAATGRPGSSSRRCSRATCRKPMQILRPRRVTSGSCRARGIPRFVAWFREYHGVQSA